MLSENLELKLRTTGRHKAKLNELGIFTIKDLLQYFPRTYNDNRKFTKISELRTDEINIVKGKLSGLFNMKTKYGKKITRGVFTDETGSIEVVWFNQSHLTRMLPRNCEIILMGKAKFNFGKISLQSPKYEFISQIEQIHSGRIVPVYHETEGITSKWIREKLKPLITSEIEQFTEYLPEETTKENNLIDYKTAIQQIHFPKNENALKKARFRLAFNELLLLQLKLIKQKEDWQKIPEKDIKIIETKTEIINECVKSLPFTLTGAQKRTINEILTDLGKPYPMSRLIQGDVGSGKTIVAALITLNTAKNGFQTAIMAPTEILAKQHYKSFTKTLKQYNFNIQLLIGSMTAKQKENIIRQIKTKTADIVIGTHALIQEKIKFANLGLAIIDEQHRFGVKQREILKSHGTPNLLTMTATPIPRTLAITIYGDQELSIIDEMPKGRQQVITKIVKEKDRMIAYKWIEDQIQKGRQAFIVCPLIEESEILELKAVQTEYAFLSEHIFPDLKLGLLHGRLKQEEKDEIMKKFNDNQLNILVSTSVIEVGIDIPNATIMVIEGAERFGLAQLHQFRGRVGRGEHKSYCFLFTKKTAEESQKRLKAMEAHTDGFKLAEIDLEIRGPGEIYGIKQSGIPDLKMAKLTDTKTMEMARKAAQNLLNKDPELSTYPQLKHMLKQSENININD